MNFLKYSALRLGLLIVVFVAGLYLRLGILFAGLAAIIIAFAVCYIFFPKLHVGARQDLGRWISRSPKIRKDTLADEDAEAEDSYVDATGDTETTGTAEVAEDAETTGGAGGVGSTHDR
ncbi:DUF4229 domain-containing protein [Kocuria sp.]|uniref:DUF4229 domain-containing protein n=1 Tax=Kocuria sp. TaxID=1871328 RepID=UPI0026DF4C6C|nr:DUF4229 domain-containing protein [Kocuria sp.]MDO5617486.1 DUF4229 domain-containing protein [Kocuria sp.]